jgi:hypothetical protein
MHTQAGECSFNGIKFLLTIHSSILLDEAMKALRYGWYFFIIRFYF